MRRRDFIKVFAGSMSAWPLAARAQNSPGKIKRPLIGVLALNSSEDDAVRVKWFLDALALLGYVDGKNATIIVRYAGGNPKHCPHSRLN